MWIVVRCLLGDEIADEAEAFGPYATKEQARAKRVELCKANFELDPLDFEANCYVLKLK